MICLFPVNKASEHPRNGQESTRAVDRLPKQEQAEQEQAKG
jgi:hypothetical protein